MGSQEVDFYPTVGPQRNNIISHKMSLSVYLQQPPDAWFCGSFILTPCLAGAAPPPSFLGSFLAENKPWQKSIIYYI